MTSNAERTVYASYLTRHAVSQRSRDPVARGWVRARHADAARLLEHADRQSDVRFRLGYSVRPWAGRPDAAGQLSGTLGVIWYVEWILGGRELGPASLWEALVGYPGVRDLVLHLIHPNRYHVIATFPAAADGGAVADAIGNTFDCVLTSSGPMRTEVPIDGDIHAHWRAQAAALPRQVQADSVLALADPDLPFSVFDA